MTFWACVLLLLILRRLSIISRQLDRVGQPVVRQSCYSPLPISEAEKADRLILRDPSAYSVSLRPIL